MFFLLFLVLAQTDDLIKDLGDDSFEVRQKAQEKLTKKINFDVYVKIRDFKTDDLEIKRRIKSIKENYNQKLIEDYKIGTESYPGYPWIDMLPSPYEWKGLKRSEIINCYLHYASYMGALSDGGPKWTNYRKATDLWTKDRVSLVLKEALLSKTEKEFKGRMKKGIETIQKEIESMINGEDKYWGGQAKNPARLKKQ